MTFTEHAEPTELPVLAPDNVARSIAVVAMILAAVCAVGWYRADSRIAELEEPISGEIGVRLADLDRAIDTRIAALDQRIADADGASFAHRGHSHDDRDIDLSRYAPLGTLTPTYPKANSMTRSVTWTYQPARRFGP